MLSCMIFSKLGIYDLVLKMIWNLLDIHKSGSVNYQENWM